MPAPSEARGDRRYDSAADGLCLQVFGAVFPPLFGGGGGGGGYGAAGAGAETEIGGLVELRTLVITGVGGGVLAPLSLLRSVNALSPGAALCLVLALVRGQRLFLLHVWSWRASFQSVPFVKLLVKLVPFAEAPSMVDRRR